MESKSVVVLTDLGILMQVHSHFVSAAQLPEGSRPYSAQAYLSEIQLFIMEEIKKLQIDQIQSDPIRHDNDTSIPF